MKDFIPEPHLFIDGEWIRAQGNPSQPLRNPATEEEIGRVPHASEQNLNAALDSSARAFKSWSCVAPYDRARILKDAANLIRERAELIAAQTTREQGKTLVEARGEVLGAADTFEWFAEEGRRAYGRIVPSRNVGHRWLVMKEPVGPVAAFSPWNFPAMLSSRKIAASLSAGCTCILKPAEETPSAALAFAKALQDAGLPNGVLNIVTGVPDFISRYLIASPVIKKITFTGSTGIGKHLARLAADGMKKATFELGGHSPVIVFDDVNVEDVVKTLVIGKIRNAGQVCIAPTRFYVQEGIYKQFVQAFTEAIGRVSVGNGLDPANQMGSMANGRRIDAMERLVADATKQGARVLTGGERGANKGHFWQPTFLAEVPDHAQMMNEEPFGPLAIANPFSTLDEAVDHANRLPYGLAAYAFTESNKRSIAVARALEAGVVGINNLTVSIAEAPFGGIKESGYGSEAGQEGLDAFLNTKFVSEM
ncbi:NAD-dependent succinate-semialdehyde dehydrogenase [Burkholderia sp. Leaf177]|uniref:NAD-dependent succinate-semialdehyde dehydrogenase n=1 Tax=Burkholderia sp. Leaf177 TaxID=1736287 RepID=UPI0006FBA6D0|nr:NAD-dependent succinate-semialdehyde dehydrogenase [Burkholderia sp. Leaf177]KQR77165.1 NAD-dependent succinate-semialdehyde dehydrogenase [Burkholderia sp. Leaf177]